MKSRLKIKVLKAGGMYDPRGKEFNSFGARKSIQSIMHFANDVNRSYRKHIQRAKEYETRDNCLVRPHVIFPVLKESEDERIRKALIEYFNEQCDMSDWNGIYGYQVVAWLKKQGEQKPAWSEEDENHVIGITQIIACAIKHNVVSQKTGEMEISWLKSLRPQDTGKPQGKSALEAANEPADKIEPRFKVGDWVVANYSGKIDQVVAVSEDGYGYQLNDGLCFGVSWCDIFHVWDIKDARDGDILASDCSVFIFQKEYIAGKPTAYCGIVDGNFCQGSGGCWTNEQCHPATKEQWDTLRSKMKEAGYEWDSEKKELKEITAPKPEVGDGEEDGEEADDKAENWKLTLARQQLKHGAHIWKTPKK